jgi:hypothetical protein
MVGVPDPPGMDCCTEGPMRPSDGERMSLPQLLRDSRTSILARWKDLTLEVYADEAARFMRSEKDRFNNPVGRAIDSGLDTLCDGLLSGRPAKEMEQALDGIVRIRAVQDFSPAQAVGFVFLLKRAIREELGKAFAGKEALTELSVLDARIDNIALAAFDIYMRCREKICDIRVNEIKHLTSKLLERAQRNDARSGHPKGGSEA